MATYPLVALAILGCFLGVLSQENAQTRIPASLLECYEEPALQQRDNRLPMTMGTLIDLIRKVEATPTGNNMDMRNMVISLIHRFRLDGIVKAPRITASQHVVPYSPKGFQFFKHRLLLTNLIPGNAYQFPNASLTSLERCTLHHMLSGTVEEDARGDEGSVCSKLSQYRAQRLQRDLNMDVEVLDKTFIGKHNRRGNMRMDNDDPDTEVNIDIAPGVYNTANGVALSQCPVEDGVVRSLWGAVSAGALLSGIAAGLQPQKVTIRDLASDGGETAVNTNGVVVDNKFAATIAGDLAEVALRQGPISQGKPSVGAAGGWNSTQAPRWYLLVQSADYEASDAEIRGGLDGLILGSKVADFLAKAPNMKLSQLLDMYYSQRGAFADKYRACNRKVVMTEVTNSETLFNQVYAFSIALDKIMQLQGTISPKGFEDYAKNAVDSLYSYIPQGLNDLSCSATASLGTNRDVEGASNLIIVLDASWSFSDIYPSLAYLLENLDLSPLGTTLSLINARDGNTIINSTASLSDFHSMYNSSVHSTIPAGFNLPKVLQTLKPLFVAGLNNERSNSWGGGNSSVVLIVTGMSTVSEADVSYSVEQLRIFREEIPDLRFLYLASGSKDRFNQLVKDPSRDIFTLAVSSSDSSAPQINGVIKRIKEVPRRLVNHKCGADWSSSDSGSSVIQQYAAPQTINYYRLHPNYFFGLGGSGVVKIQGMGYGPMNVCYSRTVELPRSSNSTLNSEGITCQALTSNTVELPLADYCKGSSYIHTCAPLFVSVEALPVPENSQGVRCSENSCRYPDSMKYSITLQDLGCFSGGNHFVISAFTLLISISISFKSIFFY